MLLVTTTFLPYAQTLATADAQVTSMVAASAFLSHSTPHPKSNRTTAATQGCASFSNRTSCWIDGIGLRRCSRVDDHNYWTDVLCNTMAA
ncbi:hypothetical protein Alg130_11965 [Pyrenophora tritici-repentis]|nr:hypothetical protein Alg130_11965 [Pyrenophora tritici-repentis]KAI0603914.1 hypothetical protein TUN205_11841 [Pyrenophora tritici-repentis]